MKKTWGTACWSAVVARSPQGPSSSGFTTGGRLRVSFDAGIPIPVATLHGVPLDAPSALRQARVEPATALRQTMLPTLPEHLGRSGREWPHVDYKVMCERCRMRVAARHPGAKDL
ncbi:hypothetical protein GCM10017744_004570 [Streptomyces antimycoticus]|uniref:Uncharacterized protein n=1 Tax=Streptomyces antimycoticus TaxID=68175 RepID=A0A4D4KI73_9ACTN|nr:hypothetical protein [Streptomyces antimycoticus]GDY48635.1 hypothetical protein SANT12839_095170 [Streptomyces antimycoticus]